MCFILYTQMIVFFNFHHIIEPMNRKRTLLLFFVLGMIFPLNWLREESAFLRIHFDHIFAPEWMHVIGHLVLFSVLVFLILNTFHLPFDWRTLLLLLAAILIVGLLQEGLQLPTKGRAFGWPEVFDLAVDLVGGVLGVSFFIAYRWRQALHPTRTE